MGSPTETMYTGKDGRGRCHTTTHDFVEKELSSVNDSIAGNSKLIPKASRFVSQKLPVDQGEALPRARNVQRMFSAPFGKGYKSRFLEEINSSVPGSSSNMSVIPEGLNRNETPLPCIQSTERLGDFRNK